MLADMLTARNRHLSPRAVGCTAPPGRREGSPAARPGGAVGVSCGPGWAGKVMARHQPARHRHRPGRSPAVGIVLTSIFEFGRLGEETDAPCQVLIEIVKSQAFNGMWADTHVLRPPPE